MAHNIKDLRKLTLEEHGSNKLYTSEALNNENLNYVLQIFNMTEIYADIIVEHQWEFYNLSFSNSPIAECYNMHTYCRYVECTSSVIQALALFREKYPGHRKDEIDQCIRKATEFIAKLQNDDGSWSALLKKNTIENWSTN